MFKALGFQQKKHLVNNESSIHYEIMKLDSGARGSAQWSIYIDSVKDSVIESS